MSPFFMRECELSMKGPISKHKSINQHPMACPRWLLTISKTSGLSFITVDIRSFHGLYDRSESGVYGPQTIRIVKELESSEFLTGTGGRRKDGN
jgi:hypothetical protein